MAQVNVDIPRIRVRTTPKEAVRLLEEFLREYLRGSDITLVEGPAPDALVMADYEYMRNVDLSFVISVEGRPKPRPQNIGIVAIDIEVTLDKNGRLTPVQRADAKLLIAQLVELLKDHLRENEIEIQPALPKPGAPELGM